jgi:hypothetical protein
MTEAATIPVERDTKDFADLRDRAAYVHATGTMPTHLRTHMTNLLAKITRFTQAPAAMDGAGGSLEVAKHNAVLLDLDDHPMVQKVRDFVKEGYRISVSRELKARRPFGKVFLYRQGANGQVDHLTVQQDGSVLDRW